SLVWRGAPVKQVVEGNLLEVVHRAVGYGAARRFKNSNFSVQRTTARRAVQMARRTSTGNCAESAFN
ncbi:hypothetical protein A2U01_0089360, partial [Trifolium medium]|nr:hypothetical protein [Trifolium medium]